MGGIFKGHLNEGGCLLEGWLSNCNSQSQGFSIYVMVEEIAGTIQREKLVKTS